MQDEKRGGRLCDSGGCRPNISASVMCCTVFRIQREITTATQIRTGSSNTETTDIHLVTHKSPKFSERGRTVTQVSYEPKGRITQQSRVKVLSSL